MHAFPVLAVLACATTAWLPYLVWQPAEAQLAYLTKQRETRPEVDSLDLNNENNR